LRPRGGAKICNSVTPQKLSHHAPHPQNLLYNIRHNTGALGRAGESRAKTNWRSDNDDSPYRVERGSGDDGDRSRRPQAVVAAGRVLAPPRIDLQLHFNYSDLPVWDMLFGTFRNPRQWRARCGFGEKEYLVWTRLGGMWRTVALIGRLIPAAWRDGVYDAVARMRYRLFRKPESACPLLPGHLRSRFE